MVKPPEEGTNKGSQGFGLKKNEKDANLIQNLPWITSIVKLSKNNIIVKVVLYAVMELVTFCRSVTVDNVHALHIIYILLSIESL